MSSPGLSIDAHNVSIITLPDRTQLTVHSFVDCTDQQLREGARVLLRSVDPRALRPKFRKMIRSDRPKIEDVGTLVWAHLCKWKRGGLATALKPAARNAALAAAKKEASHA
jgi:hypothetical protein